MPLGLRPVYSKPRGCRGGQSGAGFGQKRGGCRAGLGELGHAGAPFAQDGGGSGLTCEADLDEVQRVQRQGGQDAAAHSRRQVLQPHVPQHGARRRLPRQRLARRARGSRGAHRAGGRGRGGARALARERPARRVRSRVRGARGADGAMRVKVLSRNPDDYVRETKLDLQRGERGFGTGPRPARKG